MLKGMLLALNVQGLLTQFNTTWIHWAPHHDNGTRRPVLHWTSLETYWQSVCVDASLTDAVTTLRPNRVAFLWRLSRMRFWLYDRQVLTPLGPLRPFTVLVEDFCFVRFLVEDAMISLWLRLFLDRAAHTLRMQPGRSIIPCHWCYEKTNSV